MMTCEDVPIRSENESASAPTGVLLQQPLQYLTLPSEFSLNQEGGCNIVQLPDGTLAQAIPISLFCVPASAIALPVVPSRVWSSVYNSNDKPEDNQQVHDYPDNSPPALNDNFYPNQRPPPQSVRRAGPGLEWRVTGDNEPQTTTTTSTTEKQCLFKRDHAPTNVSAFAMGLACYFMPLYTRTQRFIAPNIASCGGQSIIGGSGSQPTAELGQLPHIPTTSFNSTPGTDNDDCDYDYDDAEDDNQPTYYIIAAPPKPKRQRQVRPTAGHTAYQDPRKAYSQATNSTILTPATTPPQHPYLISSNGDFLNVEDCGHTQIPTGYLSPPESSLSASPYGSTQNSDTCSSVVSSAPVTPFYECISPEVQSFGQDQWQDWIDEIVEEVQSEIKAESMFTELAPSQNGHSNNDSRKRKASAISMASINENSASASPSTSTDSSSFSQSPSTEECLSKRAKKYSLSSLSHEEIARRKKEQNRIAAQRYRSRKSQTLEEGRAEIAHFESRNAELREEEAMLTKEIQRLKQVLVGGLSASTTTK
ncbi:bZIP transcription factor domain-containing protein [Ditylenchus destructor]|nr:bZIP transcription factor domain-containing protein [Ditylenchus destructor]